MKYSCDHCSYETDKKANFFRHSNRKFSCRKGDINGQNNTSNLPTTTSNLPSNVNYDFKEAFTKTCDNKWSCNQCGKVMSQNSKRYHYDKSCRRGLKTLQCSHCFVFLENYKHKFRHQKICIQNPDNILIPTSTPPVDVTESINTINNNINNNNIHNGDKINNSNNVNNIYQINQYNAFGDEGIKQLEKFLSDDTQILERFKQAGKKRLYGVRDIQNDIFFNPENPQGFSIIKPDKYGSSVRVRNSDGEFEYMDFNDVRDPMLNYMEKYIEIYNKTRNKYNVKFRDPKERRIVHNFLKIMNDDLDIYLNEDLKDDLSIHESDNDSDSEEDEMKYKHFDKVSLDNIHVQTKKFFKCKKGEFILKEKKGDN